MSDTIRSRAGFQAQEGVECVPMSLHYHTRVEVCGSELEIHLTLNQGTHMANSPEVTELLASVAVLVRLFTDLANKGKIAAGDATAIRAAIKDINEASADFGSDQGPSILTQDVPAGTTDIPVDSSAGWGKREAWTTSAGTSSAPGPVESGFADATNPVPSPTIFRIAAPGLVNAHTAGEKIG